MANRSQETGKGAAWGNSLFEDNAEYGLGQAIKLRSLRIRFCRVETYEYRERSKQYSMQFFGYEPVLLFWWMLCATLRHSLQVIHVRQRRRQLRDRVEAALARAGKAMSIALRTQTHQQFQC